MANQRIPLTQPIETRDGTLTKDSKTVNGYFESREGKRELIKRPGLALATTLTSAQAQGTYYFNNYLYAVINNVLYKINPSTYAVTTIGTLTGTVNGNVATCYFNQTLNQTYLFVHNQVNGYTYNPTTNLFAQVTNDNIASTTVITGGSLYSNPHVTFSAPANMSGVLATGTVQTTSGIVTGITITNSGSGYTSTDNIVATITDSAGTNWTANTLYTAGQTYWTGSNLYAVTVTGVSGTIAPTFTGNTAQADGSATSLWLTSSNAAGTGAYVTASLNGFPSGVQLVPGAPYLDTYTVIAGVNGEIFTSNPNNPTKWNALNYITAESEPDALVGISKHLNYIVTFGQWSIDWYYDGGNYPGSPLTYAPTYKIEMGCANGDSIQAFQNIMLFIGTSREDGASVYKIEGQVPQKVSTPYIDRILNTSTLASVRTYAFRLNGHTFYVLTLHDLNLTLVFDVNEQTWQQWTMFAIGDADSGINGIYAEQYFRPSFFADVNGTYFVLDDNNGKLYTMSSSYYTDAGASIYLRSVTDIIDNGTTKRKFYNRLEIVGDKIPATLFVRHTSDDYVSWSNYRSINLNSPRSQIYQSGASRRRAWEFLITDNQPIRLDAAEIEFVIGEMENEAMQPTQYRK